MGDASLAPPGNWLAPPSLGGVRGGGRGDNGGGGRITPSLPLSRRRPQRRSRPTAHGGDDKIRAPTPSSQSTINLNRRWRWRGGRRKDETQARVTRNNQIDVRLQLWRRGGWPHWRRKRCNHKENVATERGGRGRRLQTKMPTPARMPCRGVRGGAVEGSRRPGGGDGKKPQPHAPAP